MAKPPSPDKKSKVISPTKVKKVKKGKVNKATESKVIQKVDRKKKWKAMAGEKPNVPLAKKPNNQNGNNVDHLTNIGIHLGPKTAKKVAENKVDKMALNLQKKNKVKTLIKNINVESTTDSSNKSPAKANKKLKAVIVNKAFNKIAANKCKKRTRSKRKSLRISEGLEILKASEHAEAFLSVKKKSKKSKKSIVSDISNDALIVDPLKKGRGRPKSVFKPNVNGNVDNIDSIKKSGKKKSKKGLTTGSVITLQPINDKLNESTNNVALNDSVLKKRGRPLKKKTIAALAKLQANGVSTESIGKKKSKRNSALIAEGPQKANESNIPRSKKKESIQIGNEASPKLNKKLAKVSLAKKLQNDEGNRRSERTKDKKDLVNPKSLTGMVKKKEKLPNGKAKKSEKMKKAILNVLDDSQIVNKKKKSL